MGKYQMPTVQEFLRKKRLYSKKKDLEWVYLEEEMLKNIHNKPYNQKVHDWLQFLKELRHYYHKQRAKEKRSLVRLVGPSWYCELSSQQRAVLDNLKAVLHQDLLEDVPRRMRQSLHDLGLIQLANTLPRKLLMRTMAESMEDPGVFIWKLYTAIFNTPPNELRAKYTVSARILMSSLVCIDYDECVQALEKLTYYKKSPSIKKEPVVQKYFEPKVPLGPYLQKMYVPVPEAKEKKKKEALPLGNKFRLRSIDSYEALIKDDSFLEKRILRNKHEQEKERVCTYKFWEPPGGFRSGTDKASEAIALKMKMLKKKAKLKFKTPYKNIQAQNAGVCYTGGRPNFIISNICSMPMGYIIINEGIIMINGEPITAISGFWTYPKKVVNKCDSKCDCLEKWEERIMQYTKESKCKCGHLYDFKNEGKPSEKFFFPPNKHSSYWIDKAKVFQMDPVEDFIKEAVKEGLKSNETPPPAPTPSISASVCKESELLAAFLADVSDTCLIIPHLPQGNLLINLQQWVRNRVKGPLTAKQHRRLYLESLRQWLILKHMDHRARAFSIPFTEKELKHINWSHRYMIQKLFLVLLDNFVTRNRLKQVEQSRLWWPTTKFEFYPGKGFLDTFFTYLPARMQDVYFLEPYSSKLTPKYGAKTCPLVF